MIEEKKQYYYFTFCGTHQQKNNYVKFYGTHESTRNEMVCRYGDKWGFQYTEDKFKHQPKEYGLTEIL